MPFVKKTWQDRISDHPLRRTLTPIDGSAPMTVDVSRSEGNVTEPGDPFNASTMNDLEQRIEDGIGGGDANLAPIEASPLGVSEHAYVKGEHLIFNGKYCVATNAIAVGDSLVENVNIAIEEVGDEITTINGQLRVNSVTFYFDYHDGKYGFNTSPTRGADTFIPFKTGQTITIRTAGTIYGLRAYCNGIVYINEVAVLGYGANAPTDTWGGSGWNTSTTYDVPDE